MVSKTEYSLHYFSKAGMISTFLSGIEHILTMMILPEAAFNPVRTFIRKEKTHFR